MTALSALPALAQSALDSAPYRNRYLDLAEQPAIALLRVHSLRDRPGDSPDLADWPVQTGGCLEGDPAVFCLRPREWLCLSASLEPGALRDRYEPVTDTAVTAVYDLSDALAVFRLSGDAAPWLLAKLSALDFLAGAAGGAHCARTRMGDAAVIVHYRGNEDGAFDLMVDRSLARYLWELLTDSAPHAVELARSGWPQGVGAAE